MTIQIFADTADIMAITDLVSGLRVAGITTNPTLMREAGVENYREFAREVLDVARDLFSVSFEVFADDFPSMGRQAREIASWGENVYVKIPVTNTKGESSAPLIRRLSADKIKLNVTAVFTVAQVSTVAKALDTRVPSIVSVFAGRIADTGRDPIPIMYEAAQLVRAMLPHGRVLWASVREVLNVYQAEAIGCNIITLSPGQIGKLALASKDLTDYSRETVEMFHRDAKAAAYEIGTSRAAA